MSIHLECCCCGGDAGRWKQHWNRDDGYGICMSCVAHQVGRYGIPMIEDLYGKEGVNWGEEK